MRFVPVLIACVALAGCIEATGAPPPSSEPASQKASRPSSAQMRMFRSVVAQMEPVAERICRNRTRGANCDFRIVVDTRAGLPPNAYQTLDESRRPILGFTSALIADVRNADELAFILGHEAAHHIEGHIPQTQQSAVIGAVLGTVGATILGADPATVETAQRIGGTVGARRFSKGFELEADALGTLITHRAGFDPVRGAQYFNRIPDPGNQLLGTHPPNADRIATVRRVAAGL